MLNVAFQPCTSGTCAVSPLQNAQSYVFSVDEQVVRDEILQNRQSDGDVPSASDGDAHDFQFGPLEQTSVAFYCLSLFLPLFSVT